MKPLALIVIAFTFFQCTIEKRIYQKGYHVEWNTNKYADPKATKETVSITKEIDTTAPGKILLKEEIPTLPLDNQPKQMPDVKKLVTSKPNDFFENGNKCGVIELTSGEKIEYSSSKVVDNKLLYKVCHDRLSFWKEIEMTDVLIVNKANGEIIYSIQDKALNADDNAQNNFDSTKSKSRKMEKLGLYSLLLYLVIIGATVLLFSTFSYTLTVLVFILGIMIPFILMIILSLKSLKRIRTNRDAYKLKWLSIPLALFTISISFFALLGLSFLIFYDF